MSGPKIYNYININNIQCGVLKYTIIITLYTVLDPNIYNYNHIKIINQVSKIFFHFLGERGQCNIQL